MKGVSAFIYAVIILLSPDIFGQRNCATNEVFLEQIANNPHFLEKVREIEYHTQSVIRSHQNTVTGVITIPVHVIVVYSTTEENISYAQIESQITVLNEDFSKLNPDWSLTPDEFYSRVADIQIQFILDGVECHENSRTYWGTTDLVKSAYPPYAPRTHLNIWVCNIGGGTLGYAQFPGGNLTTDGIVISTRYFGSNDFGTTFNLSPYFDKGRTATHEVGHWLNLRHIWGDGPCGATDFVDDTPDAAIPHLHCPVYPQYSCNNSNMFMNYMDYVDDACMFMFTTGQKERIRAIFEPGGSRESFISGVDTCDVEACDGNIGFFIKINNYSQEISWMLTEANGTLVDHSQNHNKFVDSMITSWHLIPGQYILSMNDSPSFGLPAPGTVSYILEDGCNKILKSTDNFIGSESIAFCVPDDSSGLMLPIIESNTLNLMITDQQNPSNDTDHINNENTYLIGYQNSGNELNQTSNQTPSFFYDNMNNATDDAVVLYPNPVLAILNLKIKTDQKVYASIHSLSGVLIQTYILENEINHIDILSLDPGIYLIKFLVDQNTTVKLFIKE